jgi:hypothetical protein
LGLGTTGANLLHGMIHRSGRLENTFNHGKFRTHGKVISDN